MESPTSLRAAHQQNIKAYETNNDFISKIGLEKAVHEVYAAAQKWVSIKSLNSFFVFKSIANNFTYFARSEYINLRDVSDFLQEALLIYIEAKKIPLSEQAIVTALEELKAELDGKSKDRISLYQQISPELLLANGIQRYNDNPRNQGRNIAFENPHSHQVNSQLSPEIKKVAYNNVMEKLNEAAWFTTNAELNSTVVLCRFISNFDQLKDDLPVAIVLLAKSEKGHKDAPLLATDLKNALSRLKEDQRATEDVKELISKYEPMDPDLLLAKSMGRYNEFLNSLQSYNHGMLSLLNRDLHLDIHGELPLRASARLGQTNKANLAVYKDRKFWQARLKDGCKAPTGECPEKRFREHPEFRKPEHLPVDEAGIIELGKQIGIENCDAITIQKIINRELTIENFQEPVETRSEHLLPIDRKGRNYLKSFYGLDCGPNTLNKIMKKEISVKEAKQLQDDFEQEIELAALYHSHPLRLEFNLKASKVVQKYVLDGSLEIIEARKMHNHPIENEDYQQYIDSGTLNMKLACGLPNGFAKYKFPLTYFGVRNCVDRFGLPMEKAVVLTEQQCQDLDNDYFEHYFSLKRLRVDEYFTLSEEGLKRLRQPRQQLFDDIREGFVTVQEVADTVNYTDKRLTELADKRRKEKNKQNGIFSWF